MPVEVVCNECLDAEVPMRFITKNNYARSRFVTVNFNRFGQWFERFRNITHKGQRQNLIIEATNDKHLCRFLVTMLGNLSNPCWNRPCLHMVCFPITAKEVLTLPFNGPTQEVMDYIVDVLIFLRDRRYDSHEGNEYRIGASEEVFAGLDGDMCYVKLAIFETPALLKMYKRVPFHEYPLVNLQAMQLWMDYIKTVEDRVVTLLILRIETQGNIKQRVEYLPDHVLFAELSSPKESTIYYVNYMEINNRTATHEIPLMALAPNYDLTDPCLVATSESSKHRRWLRSAEWVRKFTAYNVALPGEEEDDSPIPAWVKQGPEVDDDAAIPGTSADSYFDESEEIEKPPPEPTPEEASGDAAAYDAAAAEAAAAIDAAQRAWEEDEENVLASTYYFGNEEEECRASHIDWELRARIDDNFNFVHDSACQFRNEYVELENYVQKTSKWLYCARWFKEVSEQCFFASLLLSLLPHGFWQPTLSQRTCLFAAPLLACVVLAKIEGPVRKREWALSMTYRCLVEKIRKDAKCVVEATEKVYGVNPYVVKADEFESRAMEACGAKFDTEGMRRFLTHFREDMCGRFAAMAMAIDNLNSVDMPSADSMSRWSDALAYQLYLFLEVSALSAATWKYPALSALVSSLAVLRSAYNLFTLRQPTNPMFSSLNSHKLKQFVFFSDVNHRW